MSAEAFESEVWRVLTQILDPEFGVNIVDLGLIYSVACSGGEVSIVLTLTSEACPAGIWISEGVKAAAAALPGVTAVTVNLVFDPAWSTTMLSENARRQLGVGSG